MNLFADYIQPLTHWLQANPNWSLFITFFVALTESLAIIGSIIPGSVTMTALGILAGSGVLRLDLTLVAAALGAICGDSLSYAIGYYYSERLIEIWPFNKYPTWMQYGKDFFARHGGKSVIIGRFIGPLRSLIPVIAGIMRMKQWRFLLANIISAIGWSLLYVLPGAFIGAASHELSHEHATRLFMLILLLLAGIWLFSVGIKWLFILLNTVLERNLQGLWLYFKHRHQFIYQLLTPKNESNHYPTATLILLMLFSVLVFVAFTLFSIKVQWLQFINTPIYLFLNSFHTPMLKAFFIACLQFSSVITLAGVYVLSCVCFLYWKQFKAIIYSSSILISGVLFSWLLAWLINSPRPQGFQILMSGSSFPVTHIVVATAFYSFLLFYITNSYSWWTNTLKTVVLIFLGLSGFATVFLGDSWFTDVIASYFLGLFLCLLHYAFYRTMRDGMLKKIQADILVGVLFSGIVLGIVLSLSFNFKTLVRHHLPYHQDYVLNKTAWWNQQRPVLPVYLLNRVGKRISLFNIQYVGNLNVLQSHLEQMGWQTHTESFFAKLMMRMNSPLNEIKLPLLVPLYENKPPELVLTYKIPKLQLVLELSIWESNYLIEKSNEPIWIGTLHHYSLNKKTVHNFLEHLIPALHQFTLRRIELPQNMIRPSKFPTVPYILLIKTSS